MKMSRIFNIAFMVLTSGLSMFLYAGRAAGQEQLKEEWQDGRVYVMSNQAAGNTIVVLHRAVDGSLTFLQEVSTGGLGSGPGVLPAPLPPGPGPNPLETQDPLIATEDGRFLLAANAGSNELSVLAVTENGLRLVDKVGSEGIFPSSIAFHKGLVYVINQGENPNVRNAGLPISGTPCMAGFRLDSTGKLHRISNSTRVIGVTGADPADIVFSPDGDLLVVTEKITNLIDVFRVTEDGHTGAKISFPANNPTPFSLAFGRHGVLAVTEADAIFVGGRREGIVGGSTTSTYRLTDDDTLEPVSKAVPNNQTVTCWHRFTPDGRFIFTASTGSGSVSSYKVSRSGELTLLEGFAGDTGGPFSGPIDLDITPDGRFLYVVSGFIGTVKGYRIEEDGSLTPVATVGGFPISMAGIAAR